MNRLKRVNQPRVLKYIFVTQWMFFFFLIYGSHYERELSRAFAGLMQPQFLSLASGWMFPCHSLSRVLRGRVYTAGNSLPAVPSLYQIGLSSPRLVIPLSDACLIRVLTGTPKLSATRCSPVKASFRFYQGCYIIEQANYIL